MDDVLANITLISYSVTAAGFSLLAVLLVGYWRVRPFGPVLLFCCLATITWASTIALGTLAAYPPLTLIQFAELARNSSWLFFLLQLLATQDDGNPWRWLNKPWVPLLAGVVLIAAAVLALRILHPSIPGIDYADAVDASLMVWLLMAVVGLLLIEQLYRNAQEQERWGVKFLCLGVGTLFAFDLVMYAEALLFRNLDSQLWQARGFIIALTVPWLAVAIARNRNWRMDVHVSRQVVFHTVTLMGAGVYLLAMAVIGYFIKYLGGTWGGVLQISFLAAGSALLFTLLVSGTLRARLRVYLAKNFFSYRYDYRVEWLRFTEGLAARGDVERGVISNIAPIALSPGGLLLSRDSNDSLKAVASWELDEPDLSDLGNLAEWLTETSWVIDLDEYQRDRDLYGTLEIPSWLTEHEKLWLIVPLFFGGEIEGILFLARTDLKKSVNWEDRDLLKTAGRQAAALLAQQRASSALVEARQFEAFNRLSAYVVHDLKNILAQQSLMVANAQKHRDNPAFVDDMISTVENSVGRMQRLMDQMRSGLRSSEAKRISLSSTLQKVISNRSGKQPEPKLAVVEDAWIIADRERLATVFGHIIQNAQDATNEEGSVEVNVEKIGSRVCVAIADTGSGMSESFVRDQLFKPFSSTKGLTGMGIGAFESREYVRQLGGDIHVKSVAGEGSCFSIWLPCDPIEEGSLE
ncbi:MAG: XrtA/PEP-CTERM system histidine kinase PrsK [Pseudomonadota bacterium]